MMTRSNFPKQVSPAMKRPVKKAGKGRVTKGQGKFPVPARMVRKGC